MTEPLTARHCGVCGGAIEERLARLELRVKRGKRVATATMVLLVVLSAWSVAARGGKAHAAGSGARDLVARSLTIVDEKGTPRVSLAITDDSPGVNLNDEKGNVRLSLVVLEDGPVVVLNDEKRTSRVFVAATKDGPSVELNDENGRLRAALGSTSLESPRTGATEVTAPSSLTLIDRQRHVIWKAP